MVSRKVRKKLNGYRKYTAKLRPYDPKAPGGLNAKHTILWNEYLSEYEENNGVKCEGKDQIATAFRKFKESPLFKNGYAGKGKKKNGAKDGREFYIVRADKGDNYFQATVLEKYNHFVSLIKTYAYEDISPACKKYFSFFSNSQMREAIDMLRASYNDSQTTQVAKKSIVSVLDLLGESIKRRDVESLEEIGHDDWFAWPKAEIASKHLDMLNWASKCKDFGLMGAMGYNVGKSSQRSMRERRDILRDIFEMNIPNNPQYYDLQDTWGRRVSSARLQKMAESIDRSVKKAEPNPKDYSVAISDWKCDLKFLYDEYYCGLFHYN